MYLIVEEISKRLLEAEILYAESKLPISRNQIGGIEVIDRATPSKVPVAPQLKFILVISGIAGLVLVVLQPLYSSNILIGLLWT